ncbi:hypothetical protein J2Z69_002178 [Paenibacillus shirakamiensis]|uniref:Lipoprotein n=1 Tax=Paenibacillus shirakamiensis TaxID=1265935 RepID=A0ABS4JHD1_9BACL|nr:hypothetical protein [Paenibacillus shirakamiensis]MBP2001135.1 hypothetical protein [Paenibacillus shirakamiensis]
MKKTTKKASLIVSLTLLSTVCIGTITSYALDPLTFKFETIRKTIANNKSIEIKNLIKVGNEYITNKDVSNYKTYNSISTLQFDDATILQQIAEEKLFLQLAKKNNVEASLEDGKLEAKNNREILKKQSAQVQSIQKNFIYAMGIDEDIYWESYAPAEYQKLISAKNLTNKLISDKAIKIDGLSGNEFANEIKDYKGKLYNSSIDNGNIQSLDQSIILKKI